MSIPTKGEEFTKLIEHLRLGQEAAAMLAHLSNNDGSKGRKLAMGWLAVEQQLKLAVLAVTALATRGLQ
jgi:hypothetical protein